MTSPEHLNAAAVFVDRHVAEGRDAHTAFRVDGRPVSYAELAADVDRAGNALADLGVEIEHRVLLVLDDGPAFAAAFWGTVKLGAVAVPVNTLMGTEDYAFILRDSRARVAVVQEHAAARLLASRESCPFLRAVVVVGGASDGAVAWDDLLGKAATRLPPVSTFREDVAYWGYTSGSTGRPKAAIHSHKDLVAAADLVGIGVFGIGPADLVFSASKMSFAFGLGNSLLFPARVGAASVLVAERLGPEQAFEIITRERPTLFFTVPTLYARMLAVPDAERRYDLSSLRLCVSSGESLPVPLFDAWRQRFGTDLHDVVGSTENLHDFIATPPGLARRGSAGRLVPGFEARIVDDEDRPVAAGEVGHLLIKGETTSPGYWNRLERTRGTMLGAWLRTGDMFSQDAEGYFYFAGRSDDMLKVAGQWVSPAEVEARLLEHPAVLEAAVVGRQNGAGLVRAHAFVALRPDRSQASGLEDELLAFVRSGLAGYKVPGELTIVTELPRTATGKIQRFRLR